MAWARTARTSDPGASSSEPTWTTASFTPTADSLLVITVGLMHDGNSTAPADTEVISVSGGSLTWTERTGNDGDSRVTGVWGGQHAVFTAPVGGSPSSMTIVIDVDSAAGVDWFPGWIVLDVTGHDVTTPIAAANPPNSSSERKSGGDAETHTHTLTNAPESGNLVLVTMACQNDVSSPYTIPTGFTSITNLSGVNAHSFAADHETTTTAAITCDDLGDDVFLVMASGLEFTPASAGQTIAVGVLPETNALIGVDPEKIAPIGTLGEVDGFVAVPPEKIASIGTLAEVDAFLAIQAEKFVDIGTLAEFNTFLPIPALKPILLAIGTLAEANSLLAIQALKQAPIGTLGETDVFNPIIAVKPIIQAVGVLTELNNLLPVVVVQEGGQTIPVGTLAEINAFLSILARKIAAIGVLSESDTLVPITARKIFDVGTLNEVNAFLAIEILGTADIGTLSELEALLSIAADKPITTAIGTLSEDDVLVAVNALRVAQIGTLDELDVLIAIAALKPITVDVGTLAELDALVQILAEAGPEVLRKVTAILQDGLLSGIDQAGLTGRGV